MGREAGARLAADWRLWQVLREERHRLLPGAGPFDCIEAMVLGLGESVVGPKHDVRFHRSVG